MDFWTPPRFLKPGCLHFLAEALFCALLCPFVFFCALLRTCDCARLHSFALFCAHLRSFACFCVRPRLERPRLGTAEAKPQGSKKAFRGPLGGYLGTIYMPWAFGEHLLPSLNNPVLLFLGVFVSLIELVFWSVFYFFPSVLKRGSQGEENLCCL